MEQGVSDGLHSDGIVTIAGLRGHSEESETSGSRRSRRGEGIRGIGEVSAGQRIVWDSAQQSGIV